MAIKVDFVGLNTLIIDPVASGSTVESTASVGRPDKDPARTYRNTDIATLPAIHSLVALNLHRNGPYGWPSWKQVRNADKPIVKFYKKNSIFTYVTLNAGSAHENLSQTEYKVRTEPVVSYNSPLKYSVTLHESFSEPNVVIKMSYTNDSIFFANEEVDNDFEIDKESILASQAAKQFQKLYLDSDSETIISSFNGVEIIKNIFPANKNNFGNLRTRPTFVNDFWRNNRTNRNSSDDGANVIWGLTSLTHSIWGLDAESNYLTYDASLVATSSNTGAADSGDLQNYEFHVHGGSPGAAPTVLDKNSIQARCLYALKHTLSYTSSVVGQSGIAIPQTGALTDDTIELKHLFGGNAEWLAGSQAGYYTSEKVGTGRKATVTFTFNSEAKEPFYDSYDGFSDIINFKAKGYSVLPEYKISDDYEDLASSVTRDSTKNLVAEDTFTVSGGIANRDNSSKSKFYETYSFSDFVGKDVSSLISDHNEFAIPNKIKFTVKGILKLLPYEGFYPAERTIQLAQEFKQSYDLKVDLIGPDRNAIKRHAKIRTFLTPFYGPGIMYNSIKSGMAVDFPIFTGSYDVSGGVGFHGDAHDFLIISKSVGGGSFDYRVPFEAIVNPDNYMMRMPIVDMFPHISSSMRITASLHAEGDIKYKLMAENFFAEVPNFFLNGFTTLTSEQEDNPTFGVRRTKGKYDAYAMRLKMYRSLESLRGVIFSDTAYQLPQDPTGSQVKESFTMYSRPSAFGPPTMGASLNPLYDSRGGYNFPYTPPYYHGEAWADVVYHPDDNSPNPATLADIFEKSDVTYTRVAGAANRDWPADSGGGIQERGLINTNALQLSSSLNIFGLEEVIPTNLNATSNTSRWVISPKFETPMLNFADATISVPTRASQSVPRGMWHQYGFYPTSSNTGIFMQVQDVPSIWTDARLGLLSARTGSLADLIGFSKDPVRMGEVPQSKEISEAVVVVPFIDNGTTRSFVSVERKAINNAIAGRNDSDSVSDMVEKMQKYYLPPEFNFIEDQTISPFSMYIFEFKYDLLREDLTNIWQNLPPKIATNFEEKEVTYEHEIDTSELLGSLFQTYMSKGGLPAVKTSFLKSVESLRFMVFKVKRRAASVYGDQVYISSLPQPITKKTSARFNWPYDHFSLIEYASVDFSMSIGQPNENQLNDMENETNIPSKGKTVKPSKDTDSNEGETVAGRTGEREIQGSAGQGTGRSSGQREAGDTGEREIQGSAGQGTGRSSGQREAAGTGEREIQGSAGQETGRSSGQRQTGGSGRSGGRGSGGGY